MKGLKLKDLYEMKMVLGWEIFEVRKNVVLGKKIDIELVRRIDEGLDELFKLMVG